MNIIKFRRLNNPPIKIHNGISTPMWEIAFSEEHLNEKLNGELAEIIMPAKPWYVRLWRKFFPLKSISVPADGKMREFNLK